MIRGRLWPATAPLILLIAGRDDWRRDIALNQVLIARLQATGLRVEWEDAATPLVHRWLAAGGRLSGLPGWIIAAGVRAAQLAHALVHPSYWWFLARRALGAGGPPGSIGRRVAQLRARVRGLAVAGPVAILARSSGGRAASLLADGEGVAAIICLGYPFRHPDRGEWAERTAHLADLRTPMLILQGCDDAYGGRDLVDRTVLAAGIDVVFLATDHDFLVAPDQIDWIVARIVTALAGLAGGPE